MYPAGFDRPDADSVFLKFVAMEFMRRGTPRRKELATKPIAHAFVSGLGMSVPDRLGIIEDIEQLQTMELPEAFVLKPVHGWSARGVMLLRRAGRRVYFDHLSLRRHGVSSIVRLQQELHDNGRASGGWIIEEAVQSLVSVGPVPFDYKFYSFNGAVGLVIQIDRNTFPTRVALFDGSLRPLEPGTDYLLGGRTRQARHVVPLHAPEMLYWAQELSRHADSPFVSIDMYDSPGGPKFGEFTYSPGGAHKRMFVFAERLIDQFDAMMAGEFPDDPLRASSLQVRRSVPLPDSGAYTAWASYAYNEGARGAERLRDFHRAAGGDHTDSEAARWARHLAGAWDQIRDSLASSAPRHIQPQPTGSSA